MAPPKNHTTLKQTEVYYTFQSVTGRRSSRRAGEGITAFLSLSNKILYTYHC